MVLISINEPVFSLVLPVAYLFRSLAVYQEDLFTARAYVTFFFALTVRVEMSVYLLTYYLYI